MAEENRGCLWALLRLFGWRPKPTVPRQAGTVGPPVQQALALKEPERETIPPFPYHTRRFVLSPRERAFYHMLKKAAGDRLVICPQVRLADIFATSYHEAFGKIASRHVDFLLCYPSTFQPIAGVELDDASHGRPERIKQDEFKEQVFTAAKLRLIRVPVQENYNVQTLETLLNEVIAANPPQPMNPLPEQDLLVPLCPKCGEAMIMRVAQQGFRKGQPFYGCSKYPTCKGTLPYETMDNPQANTKAPDQVNPT